jgi:hypothetical protein
MGNLLYLIENLRVFLDVLINLLQFISNLSLNQLDLFATPPDEGPLPAGKRRSRPFYPTETLANPHFWPFLGRNGKNLSTFGFLPKPELFN